MTSPVTLKSGAHELIHGVSAHLGIEHPELRLVLTTDPP